MKDDNDIVLSVKNVSKCFEMYEKPVHRLYQTLCAGKKKFFKEFWALRDISFDVHRGECVGIVGRNGAGKSTLLQIVTGTLTPTSGQVVSKGRVAALLELGSGFNPEFTGRENVYLNGAILGLSKEEIDRRYDDILAFADIGEFIDQPVKTYSSGMMVRLAFAVNVFVEPDIMIIDEALSVGDAAFQLKCAKRLKSLFEKNTTVLFVSHDVNAVRSHCNRAIWLNQGCLRRVGDVKSVTEEFLREMFSGEASVPAAGTAPVGVASAEGGTSSSRMVDLSQLAVQIPTLRRWGTGEVVVDSIFFSGHHDPVEYGQRMHLRVRVVANRDFYCREGLACAFSIRNRKALDIVCCTSSDERLRTPALIAKGQSFIFSFTWRNELASDEYVLAVAVQNDGDPERLYCDYVESAAVFKTMEPYRIYALTRPECQMEMEGET